MNFMKKLFFILLLIAVQLSVKTGTQAKDCEWQLFPNTNIHGGEQFSATSLDQCKQYCIYKPTCRSIDWSLTNSQGSQCFHLTQTTGKHNANNVDHYDLNCSTSECGGTYSDLSMTISSPNYPSNYDNNVNCSYYIQIPAQQSINITFLSFATESGYDILKVSCGSTSSIYTQRFYGPTLPPVLSISSCSNVSLEFSTDRFNTHKGFSLRYDIGTGFQGGLTMKPVNTYVYYSSTEPVVLSCSSTANGPDAQLWWSFSRDGGLLFWDITDANCIAHPPPPGYAPDIHSSITRLYESRTCNITIPKPDVNFGAGIYSCTDATLDYAFALVTFINPTFTSSVNLNSLETEVVRGDQISYICSVQFFPNTTSYHQLSSSVYIYSDHNPSPIVVSSTSASINFSAPPEVLPSYVCNINFTFSSSCLPSKCATNPPKNISLMIPSRQVLYGPENTSMIISGDDNGNFTCFAPANPPATYQWANEGTNRLWKGSNITVSDNGIYTCTASSIIRGKRYEASKSISATIKSMTIIDCQKEKSLNEPEKDNSSLIVGVVLGIVVLLLLVVAIVEFVLLYRKKQSAAIAMADPNYDYIHPVTRTDSDPAKPHVYELTQRESLDVGQGGEVATSSNKDVAPMYDRITSQIYDTEIHAEDKSQPYLGLYE